jgi:SAM-dependent methyltransferase
LDSVIYRSRQERLAEVARLWGRYLAGSMLDVGCDVRHLADLVPGDYTGIDIAGSPDLRVDLEHPLPFADRAFDTLVCMDVLEHVDGIHHAFDEMCRVSGRWVILSLPNGLGWWARMRMVRGRFGAKYGLAPDPPADRHRWIFTLAEARAFVRERGARRGYRVIREACAYPDYRHWLPLMVSVVGRWLAPRGAGLLAIAYWCVLERDNG